MDFGSAKIVHEPHDGGGENDTPASAQVEKVSAGERKHHSSAETVEGNKIDTSKHENYREKDSGDVDMDACISADDVMRAGGFGARDDISSFLPVASDSTDFEALLRDAREYEEPQKEICRPGLGWKDVKNQD